MPPPPRQLAGLVVASFPGGQSQRHCEFWVTVVGNMRQAQEKGLRRMPSLASCNKPRFVETTFLCYLLADFTLLPKS